MAELIGERGGIRYRLQIKAKSRTCFSEPQRFEYSLWADTSCLLAGQTEIHELYGLLQLQQVGELFQRISYLRDKKAPFMLGADGQCNAPYENLCLLAETDFLHIVLWHQASGYCAYVHLNRPGAPPIGDTDDRLCVCFCVSEEDAVSFGNGLVVEASLAEAVQESLETLHVVALRC